MTRTHSANYPLRASLEASEVEDRANPLPAVHVLAVLLHFEHPAYELGSSTD